MTQVAGSLPPTWENQMEFLAPVLAQHQPFWVFGWGRVNQQMGALCISALQINNLVFLCFVCFLQ